MELRQKLYIILIFFIFGGFFVGCSFNSENKESPVTKEKKITSFQITIDNSIDLVTKTEWMSGSFATDNFENTQLRGILKKRWNEIRTDLHPAMNNHILELANEIETSAKRNFERWEILGIKS